MITLALRLLRRDWVGAVLLALVLLGGTTADAAEAGSDAVARGRAVFGALLPADGGGWLMRDGRRLRLPGTRHERADLPAGTRLRLGATLRVHEAGRPHDLLLWHGVRPEGEHGGGFQDEVAVLAVFRAGDTEPIDVAEVQVDRQVFFAEPALLPLAAGHEAFSLVNHHANAGQPYAERSLYHLRQGRLRRIAAIDLLAEMGGCARAFDQVLHWRSEPDAGRALPWLVATVTLEHAPANFTADCRPRPAPRRQVFVARWRWDAAADRYRQQAGGTLDRLARFNDAHR